MKFYVLYIIAALAQQAAYSQSNWPFNYEIGIGVSRCQYYGDLQFNRAYISTGSNWAGHIFIRKHLHSLFSLRGNISFGEITARDDDDPTGHWNNRLLRFNTRFGELNIIAEIYPLKDNPFRGNIYNILSPYFLAGIGYIYTNPTLSEDNEAISPLAQILVSRDVMDGRRFAFTAPLGAGFKINISQRINLGIEFIYRFSDSDYIDGISRAGSIKHRDGYATISFIIAYRFTTVH